MNILAFLNSYTEGKSGGDMCFIEIFKRIPSVKLSVVTSQLGKKLCRTNGLKSQYILTTKETTFRFMYGIYLVRIIKGIFIAIFKGNIDVIYITSDALPDVLPAVFAKIRNPKAKVIGKVFHIIPGNRIISSLTQQMSHFLLKIIADYIVVDNILLKDELITAGFVSPIIIVNYPALDSAYLKTIKPEKQFTATCMSRLHESKGIFELVGIWKQVIKTYPDATLGIIGKGDKKITEKLQLQIQKQKLTQHIFLLGFFPDKKAYGVIKGSDVFLFPSHEEGFGMVVGETLALGTPVIAYNLPVFHETFAAGLTFVDTFDTKQFAEKTIDILSNPQKYDRVVASGKKIIKTFSWDIAAQKELKLII